MMTLEALGDLAGLVKIAEVTETHLETGLPVERPIAHQGSAQADQEAVLIPRPDQQGSVPIWLSLSTETISAKSWSWTCCGRR